VIAALAAAGLLLLAPAAAVAPSPPAPPAPPAPSEAPASDGGDTTIFGGSLVIPAGERRDHDVVVFGGSVEVRGDVGHDLTVFGGSATLDGSVGHDVIVLGGSVHLGPHASVGHDVTVLGGTLRRDAGASVGHEVLDAGGGAPALPGPLRLLPVPSGGVLRGFDLGLGLALGAGVVLLALLALLFFPGPVATTRDALEDRPFASLGFGCLTALAGVLLALLLGITVVLLPVSVGIAVAMGVAWLLGLTGAIVLIGQRLTTALRMDADPVPTLLIGGALVVVLVNVPVLGGLFGLVIGSMALGAVVLTRFGTRPHPPAPAPLAPPAGPEPR
jgi:hypothetical protein